MDYFLKDTILKDICDYMYWNELIPFENNFCNGRTDVNIWKFWFRQLLVPTSYLDHRKNRSGGYRKAIKLYIAFILLFCRRDVVPSQIPPHLWSDRGFVWCAVQKGSEGMRYASIYKNNEKIVLNAIKHYPQSFLYISDELKSNTEFIRTAIRCNGSVYCHINSSYQTPVLLLEALEHGLVIDDVYDANSDVVMHAIRNKKYVSINKIVNRYKNNKEIIKTIVEINGDNLKLLPNDLKRDKEVVLTAVSNDGWGLRYAANELKADKDIVSAAVSNVGASLFYASHDCQNDKDIVKLALIQDPNALCYASNTLKDNKEFILSVVKDDGLTLQYASDRLKKDKEIISSAIRQNAKSITYASMDHKEDPDDIAHVKSPPKKTDIVSIDDCMVNRDKNKIILKLKSKRFKHHSYVR